MPTYFLTKSLKNASIRTSLVGNLLVPHALVAGLH